MKHLVKNRVQLSPKKCVPSRATLRQRPIAKSSMLDLSKDDLLAKSLELEREAQEIHLEAQKANKEQRFEDAKQLYKRMNDVDAESLRLACESVRHSPSASTSRPSSNSPSSEALRGPSFAQLISRQTWANGTAEDLRDRARGLILGSLMGDSAASGVQWIYNLEELSKIDAEQRGGSGDLTFMDPPQSPYLPKEVYGVGDLSPYGEQTLALLQAAALDQGLDAATYARVNFEHFSSDDQARRYRDAATKGFLRGYARGLSSPGADDFQANCATRACVVAAVMSGCGEERMLAAVDRVVRVTQNRDEAVAYATACALVLEHMVRGCGSPLHAVVETVPALRRLSYQPQLTTNQQALWTAVAHNLDAVVQGVNLLTVPEFVAKHGRNCHMPNSLTTPLYAAVYSARQGGTPTEIFARGVRLAVREGGCCASRAGITGAVLGGLVGASQLPQEWKERIGEGRWREYEALVDRALGGRA